MEALYNKYRPQIFEDVVGQEHIERTIKNAIASNKISHAYMFTGPRGTGKTTTARLLSKALLCESGPTPDPDGTCEDCELIAAGEHPDVYELDAASRTGVENVREEIIGKVDYAPTRGKFKVYIIDEVHMLSTAAFNALLKTLEEPPDHVIFIMCTTDPQKVPETILSRCQRFDFRRISSEELVSRLGAICEMEGIEFEGDALDLIAHRAQGGMRDALTSLEQLIAFGNGDVTMEVAERLLGSLDSSDLAEIVKAIGTRDIAECFNWTTAYIETGADLVQFAGDLTQHIRDMYVMSLAGTDVALDVTEAGRRELEVELSWYGPERLARMLEVLGDLLKELKTSTNQRLSFEIALTRMVRPESDLTLSSLSERIESLERAIKNGAISQTSMQKGNAQSAESVRSPKESFSEHATPADSSALQGRSSLNEAISKDGHSASGATHSNSNTAALEPSEESDVSNSANTDSYASVPANEASSSPFAQGAGLNANQIWNSTVAHLKKIGPAYGVVFMNTSVRIDGEALIIEFSKNNDFAFKASQKQDAREALEKAFERAGYPGLKYQIVQSRDGKPEQVSTFAAPQENNHEIADRDISTAESSLRAEESSPQQDASRSEKISPQEHSSQEQKSPIAEKIACSEEPAHIEDTPPWEDAIPGTLSEQASDNSFEPAGSSSESNSDLQDLLTSAFGEGVVVEEVEE